MTTTVVSNGVTSTGLMLSKGQVLDILAGGTAVDTIVLNGGTAHDHGLASGTIIANGGYEVILQGGVGLDETVASGGLTVVESGGSVSGAAVYSGGALVVLPGGSASGVIGQAGGIVASTGVITDETGISVTSGASTTAKILSGTDIQYVLKSGVASGSTVAGGAIQAVYSGGVARNTTITSGGTETLLSASIAQGVTIDGGTLVLSDGAMEGNAITFSGSDGKIDIEAATALPTADVVDFASSGDSIDFEFLTYSADDSYSISAGIISGDVLTISAGGASYRLSIDGATADGYELIQARDGSLIIAVCYYPGTLIRRPDGDSAVETLAIGDLVMTADGRALPVRWIGRNTVSTRFGDPLHVLPIRIRAGALGENRPERDLLVSPEHAVLVEDVLVQAGALVNGRTVVRETQVPETFVYYHVELSEHALILAEGTPAESFVDNISRRAFDNWAEHEALYGDAPIEEMALPRALSHRQVPGAVRARMTERMSALGLTDTSEAA